MIQEEGLPIASRVILSAHKALMERGGEKADPGYYRKQSVRVGNLVPPPPLRVPEAMTELERYINTDSTLPLLIKAGLAHVQFETIHPFLDGNGRIGRLLIVLMLIDAVSYQSRLFIHLTTLRNTTMNTTNILIAFI